MQKLELTWIGKNEPRENIEPRILIENPQYSYGEIETASKIKASLVISSYCQENFQIVDVKFKSKSFENANKIS